MPHIPTIPSRSSAHYPTPRARSNNSDQLPLYASESREQLVSNAGADRPAQAAGSWARHFQGWKLILFGSWLNILLFMIPAAWAAQVLFEEVHGLAFAFCILGLIPLVKLHDLAIAQLSIRVGGSKTGLLNASMSNFIELVVAISALRKCELRVVQASLVGSMLTKLLLVLGLCFFAGGMRFSEQGFDQTATQIHSSLLILSVGVLILPAAYHFTLSADSEDAERRNILNMSHGVSVVLILIYVSYLAFQLWSHTHLYGDHHNKKSERLHATRKLVAKSRSTFSSKNKGEKQALASSAITSPPPKTRHRPHSDSPPPTLIGQTGHSVSTSALDERSVSMSNNESPTVRETTTTSTPSTLVSSRASTESLEDSSEDSSEEPIRAEEKVEEKPPKEPEISWFLTIFLLLTVTTLVAITADWIVESMDGVSTTINKDWIALILLPIVSCIAECITSVRVSVKDELSLSIFVAVGSTIQTAVFVIPFMVLLAWVINKPLTLLMDPFHSMVLFISVQTASHVISDGKSNWLEGVILIALYVIIAVTFWFYPGSVPLDFLSACPKAETLVEAR
ncbi:Sodium/calcium exchanger protein-domain-containing protein [Coprinopsis sp. MPI-PUGE-AT-0042]|nr:Sodium/calcium exchanger protein-domain-containing protein [Coprinopsis sp. MPI-PUGE-AT-0042]